MYPILYALYDADACKISDKAVMTKSEAKELNEVLKAQGSSYRWVTYYEDLPVAE